MYLPRNQHQKCPTCGECAQCRSEIWDMGARTGAWVGAVVGLLLGILATILTVRFTGL